MKGDLRKPFGQLMKKQPDVGHQPDRLRRTPIGELGHDRRVNIDADHGRPRRQHVPDANAMEHRRQHDHQSRGPERLGVAILRDDDVGDGVDDRARDRRRVIPSSAGQTAGLTRVQPVAP